MKDLIILKIGGSSITKKAENKFEMNEEILERVAKEIAIAKKKKDFDLVLVCGVGPFGHTNVVNYNLNGKIKTLAQKEGVLKTKKDCDFVALKVITALKNNGLIVNHLPGYKVCKQDERKVIFFETNSYKKLLEKNIIPVTTGTMVHDKSFNWSVMSGDTVISELCKSLKPKKVLIGTDVNGIFTSDPKLNKKAELIELITKQNLEKVLEQCGESNSVDVTGGMKGKLDKLGKQLGNVPAEIFSLFIQKNLENVLSGKEIKSTKIKL